MLSRTALIDQHQIFSSAEKNLEASSCTALPCLILSFEILGLGFNQHVLLSCGLFSVHPLGLVRFPDILEGRFNL